MINDFYLNGEGLVKVICEKLKDELAGHKLYDSTILNRIRKLTNIELREIVEYGDVINWHNERRNR